MWVPSRVDWELAGDWTQVSEGRLEQRRTWGKFSESKWIESQKDAHFWIQASVHEWPERNLVEIWMLFRCWRRSRVP